MRERNEIEGWMIVGLHGAAAEGGGGSVRPCVMALLWNYGEEEERRKKKEE
jgi:hypothetical protein